MKISFLAGNSLQFSTEVVDDLRGLATDFNCIESPSQQQIEEAHATSDLIWWEWCKHGIEHLTSLPKRCPIIVRGRAGDILPRLEYTCIRARCVFHKQPMSVDTVRTLKTLRETAWRNVDLLLFTAPHLMDEFETLFPEIDCPKDVVFRRQLHFEDKTSFPRTAAILCRVTIEKDLEFAIRAFQDEKMANWTLVIQGANPTQQSGEWMDRAYYEHLQAVIGTSTNIRFESWANPLDLYREASLVLSTSISEGIANTVMEGMAMGCVGFVRDWAGAKECYPTAHIVSTPEDLVAGILQWDESFPPEKEVMSRRVQQSIRDDPYKGGESPVRVTDVVDSVMGASPAWTERG